MVPLCGKSVDLLFLQTPPDGHVVGIEGVKEAIETFSNESGIKLRKCGEEYVSENGKLRILNRNIFKSESFEENSINSVWDRAAFVAIKPKYRVKYVKTMKHMIDTSKRFNYLINVVEYDQKKMNCPPYSVSQQDLNHFFGDFCSIKLLERQHFTPDEDIEIVFKEFNVGYDEVLYLMTNK